MKNKLRIFFITCGTMLILSALFLCIYNIKQDQKASEESHKILSELKAIIPQPTTKEADTPPKDEPFANPADDLFAPYETEPEAKPIEIDGAYYCGIITIPSLDIELPVADSWSYAALNISPCRYSGSVGTKDLIIAAHNFSSHFGRISELNAQDEIIFTDTNGTQHRFRTYLIMNIDGYDIDEMFSGSSEDWDLTIFTCTLSGKSRVAVRACSVTEP